ncbi:YbjQ family protein [Magnetospirillum sp. 64-120]|uniref:YbjQ family protein n=1 Tax=Magnetospirillum sp. 64-120 TaxID=1895778 RepID=UPI0025BE34B7|nr:YbjQ family protein [Magnetospirillum sp. 64-120]
MSIKITCPHCGKDNELDAKRCWGCKREIPYELYQAAMEKAEAERLANDEGLRQQRRAAAEERAEAEAAFTAGDVGRIPPHLREDFASRIPLSTSPFIYSHEIAEVMGVVTAECVFGMNIFKDLVMSMTDLLGGRSKTAQKAFRDAREICLTELRKEAMRVGGNAVISIDLDYSEIGGQSKGMLFLVASGTSVKLKPNV